jgi:mycothiol synthase
MSSSLPDGFAVRPATDADAAAAAEVYRDAELAVRARSTLGPDEVLSWWRMADVPTGTFLVHDTGGRLTATGTMLTRGDAAELSAAVHPDYCGQGLGNALLALAEQRAAENRLRVLRVATFAENERAVELLERRGHRDVRHFYVMAIDLDGPVPTPSWPAGVEGDTFRDDDAQAFHAALTEAFEDEWGSVPMPYEEWRQLRIESDDFDPGLWSVAREGDTIVGVARCERLYGGGWVSSLGVRKPWRRRGIGLALLHRTFAEFKRRGEPVVRLGVDSENASGATKLYERAGMRIESEEIIYEKRLG